MHFTSKSELSVLLYLWDANTCMVKKDGGSVRIKLSELVWNAHRPNIKHLYVAEKGAGYNSLIISKSCLFEPFQYRAK